MLSMSIGVLFLAFFGLIIPPVDNSKFINITLDTSNISQRFTVSLVRGTPYNPTIAQCDSTPLGTADGSKIDTNIINNLRWCAVSQELLKQFGGKLWYGDTIYVYPIDYKDSKYERRIIGRWVIHDTMNKRCKKSMDFLCSKGYIRGVFKNLLIIKINR